MRAYSNGAWFIEHDFDGDGLTDLNDPDSDDDGLLGGAEPSPWEDTDEDGLTNIRHQNSND
ncbi:MAG TPA: hypothetical protein VGB42_01655 [Candidatus Thermoplasmatota archaeon]